MVFIPYKKQHETDAKIKSNAAQGTYANNMSESPQSGNKATLNYNLSPRKAPTNLS